MAKRHQASRRKAYGRRQHELRERFDRPVFADATIVRVGVFDTRSYDDTPDAFGAFDAAIAGGLGFALRD